MHFDFAIINLQSFSPANSCVHAQHLLKVQQLSSSVLHLAFDLCECGAVWFSKGRVLPGDNYGCHCTSSPHGELQDRGSQSAVRRNSRETGPLHELPVPLPPAAFEGWALPWLASLLILVASQRSWSLLQDCLWNVKERKNEIYLCLGFFFLSVVTMPFSGNGVFISLKRKKHHCKQWKHALLPQLRVTD